MPNPKESFVHLHVHTEYSMLDGLTKIPAMVEKVKESGMDSVAISDHGVMYGAYEFWKACNDADIKPIIGCEIYLAPSDREIREEVDGIKYYHLLLLAKDFQGYKNLVKLVSRAHLEGFYYKPRVDKELLEKYSEGLICTSACPASPLGRHLLRDEPQKAKEWLEYLHGIFKDDFYLELQRHGQIGSDELPDDLSGFNEEQIGFMKSQKKINAQLIDWSKEYDIPLIATTDAHYLDAEDEVTQEVLFAIKDGKTLNDPTKRKAYKHTYIKTPAEMSEIYSDLPQVLENTQKLADSIEKYSILFDRIQPQYMEISEGMTAKEELLKQAKEGAIIKYGELTQEILDRIQYEVDLIDDKGYSHYYLVTSDYIKWARKNDIVVSMRGSGAASVVAYSIDITSIDPLWWDLMFERFLNPKRPSPPDFDLDLEDQNRDKVIEYISEKYGAHSVAAICTFGRMTSRTAIRDVCRVMNIDLGIADTLSKLVEVNFGKPKPIDYMIENNDEFASIINSDPKLQEMATLTGKLDGIKRHLSTHACGVLITPKPIDEYIPIQKEIGSGDRTITQLDLNWIEYAGLMKFDFLGLANLTIIKNTFKLVEQLHGIKMKTDDIPLDDEKTFDLFRRGDTTSVFQFEGGGMKRFLKDLKPTSIKDICFMAAAYRPGPMSLIPDAIKVKHGEKDPEYLIPELKPILEETYGAIIYQEQIMQIAVKIAGYESYGDADLLRRAVAKKKKDVMATEEPIFKNGMVKNGFTQTQADKLWDYLLPFADYGFPKAHSAMYAVVAYWTAYLKAHYPMEFMCARLTSDMSHPDKLVVALDEAKHLNIKLLPPDINKSFEQFVPEGENSIRYGLNGVKNVGHNVVSEIVTERTENGIFTSLDDLCMRVESINSRTLESLIKVGGLDAFGNQAGLLQIYTSVLSNSTKDRQKRKAGQLGLLFDTSNGDTGDSGVSTTIPVADPILISEKLKWEKDLLGIYFTSHPMQTVIDQLEKIDLVEISKCDLKDGKVITGVALISSIRNITTKKGDPMAFVTLEDTTREVDSVLFPRDFKDLRSKINEGDIVVVTGRCKLRNGDISLIISNIKLIEDVDAIDINKLNSNESSKKISVSNNKILLIHHSATAEDLRQLRDILLENPGNIQVEIHIQNNGSSRQFRVRNKVSKDILDEVVVKLPMVESMK